MDVTQSNINKSSDYSQLHKDPFFVNEEIHSMPAVSFDFPKPGTDLEYKNLFFRTTYGLISLFQF